MCSGPEGEGSFEDEDLYYNTHEGIYIELRLGPAHQSQVGP